ncbi:hypothetical protein Cgig2_027658 [Carnegiea gigantea]|uniref:Uncharacterized protein n=1 Tax=Carnegiea gigantea TaxID=171969 RepID=A0A9Q1GNJ8_9CARY|nr:hypothetical protein Cgig2_027658 [Carnegiea gigantea]
MVFSYFLNTEQVANYIRATFIWSRREHVCPLQLLPRDYRGLCPYFDLDAAEASARDFCIPKQTQAVFYTMVLNDAMALGVTCVIVADAVTVRLSCLRKGGCILYYVCVSMSSCCSSSGNVPRRSASPQMEGCHPQFPSLPTLIDGRVVAHIPPNNQFREPKKIPYDVLIYKPDTPSWSSYEYSFTPNILSIEEDVVYPSKINVAVNRMHDLQEHRMATIRSSVAVESTSTSSSLGGNEWLRKGHTQEEGLCSGRAGPGSRGREQALEKLSPLESGQATAEQIATGAK